MNIEIFTNNIINNKKHIKCIATFSKYCFLKLKCINNIKIFIVPKENSYNITTAGYDKINNIIFVRGENRALVDVCRSIAHELVHAKQKEYNKLNNDNIPNIGGQIEDDANAYAGRLIKMFVKDKNANWIYKE